MTGALCVYALTFARYSLAVTPKNYLLFACHVVNAGAQFTQAFRFTKYHYMGGKDQMEVVGEAAKEKVAQASPLEVPTLRTSGLENLVRPRQQHVVRPGVYFGSPSTRKMRDQGRCCAAMGGIQHMTCTTTAHEGCRLIFRRLYIPLPAP
jgi:hypothetical protein